MPQLVPFYFSNILFYGILSFIFLVLLLSKYILPMILEKIVLRRFLTKL